MFPAVDGKKVVVPLSLLTVASMISSYFREIFIAAKFGAGLEADAYLSVVTIVRFASDVGPCAILLASVIPVMSSLLDRPSAVRGNVLGVLLLVTLAATGLLALGLHVAMPWLLTAAAPGFGGPARQTALTLATSLVWLLPLQSMSFLFSLALNAHGRFRAAAAAPLLSNSMFVLVLALSGDRLGVESLSLATLAGPVMMALFLGAELRRTGMFRPKPSSEAAQALRSLWGIARPMILSLGLGSSTGLLMVCQLLLRRQGSLGGEGAVAALGYAFRLYEVPVSLIANVAGTLVLPSLSALYGTVPRERFAGICRGLAEWGLLLLMPVVVITVLDARCLVDLAFGHGRFSAAAAARTAEALRGFAPAILFEAGIVVFYRVLYAIRRPKAAVAISLAVVSCLAVAVPLIPAQQVGSLAMAFSASFAVGLLMLGAIIRRQFGAAVLPFRRGALVVLAILALSAAVWLPQGCASLTGTLVFGAVYIAACMILLPRHRAAVAGLLRREARA